MCLTERRKQIEWRIVIAWECKKCEVTGRTPEGEEPRCWNCGGEVTVTARPVKGD